MKSKANEVRVKVKCTQVRLAPSRSASQSFSLKVFWESELHFMVVLLHPEDVRNSAISCMGRWKGLKKCLFPGDRNMTLSFFCHEGKNIWLNLLVGTFPREM